MAPLSLFQLLDAAISPSTGHVNFIELHGLLRAVLGLLRLGGLPVPDWGQPARGARAHPVGQQPPEPGERQPGTAPLRGTASGSRVDAVAAGVGQPEELEAMDSSSSEEGSRARSDHTEASPDMDTPPGAGSVPGLQAPGTQRAAPTAQRSSPQSRSGSRSVQPGHSQRRAGAAVREDKPARRKSCPVGTQAIRTEEEVAAAVAEAKNPRRKSCPLLAQTSSPGIHPRRRVSWADPQGAGTQPRTPSSSVDPRAMDHRQEVYRWSEFSGSSSSSTSSMDTDEAEFEALHSLYELLRKQGAQLEAAKSDRAELEKLRSELLLQQQEGQESTVAMLEDVRGQVSSLQRLASDFEQEKGKLASMLQELREQAEQLEVARATLQQLVTTSQELQEQVRCMGSSQHVELKQQLQEQAEQQEVTRATLQQLVTTSQHLQEQVEEQKAMVRSAVQEQAARQVVCSMRKDSSAPEGNLLQCIDVLQQQVDFLLSRQEEGKVERLRSQQYQELLSRLRFQEQELQQVQQQLREEMASKLDRTELGPFRQQLQEQWKRSLKQLQKAALPREANSAAGTKKQLSRAEFQCLSCDGPLNMRVPGSPIVPIPPVPPLTPRSTEKTPPSLNPGQSEREQAAGCRYPSVPRQCGGQSTVIQPVPPRTPRPLKPSTVLPSKDGDNATELLGGTSCRQDGQLPVIKGQEGTGRRASTHCTLRQALQLLPPLLPPSIELKPSPPAKSGSSRLTPWRPGGPASKQ